MKFTKKILLTALLWLVVTSCLKEDDLFKGTVSRTGITLNLGIDVAVKNTYTRLQSVSPDDFRIAVLSVDGELITSFERYGDMPDTIMLDPGNYFIRAESGNLLPGAFEAPYYMGTSDTVSLNTEEVRNVSVLCKLSNCKVTVSYSQNITENFNNYYTLVSNADTSVTFTMNETRAAYFSLKSLTVTAYLEYVKQDNTPGVKIINGLIEEPQPQKHYELHIDANLDEPASVISLDVDESTQKQVLNFTDYPGDMPGNEIAYGELLIDEIMYDPDSLSDTQGEWFEIYNASGSIIDLYHLVIRRGSTNEHIIGDHITLEPGAYMVMAKTEGACEASSKYVYGSSISLPNSGDELSLSNYGTDGNNGYLVFSLNYGPGFPDGTGASIGLNPDHLNPNDASEGSNWCVSTSAYNTGDKGTPGEQNDNCN